MWSRESGDQNMPDKYDGIVSEANDSDMFQDLLDANISARHAKFRDWAIREIRTKGTRAAIAMDALNACKLCGMVGVAVGIEMEKM